MSAHRPALKPAPRPPQTQPSQPPARSRPEPLSNTAVRHERARDIRGETHYESECFEQWLEPQGEFAQPTLCDFGQGGFSDAHPQGQGSSAPAWAPSASNAMLWDAVLTHIEDSRRSAEQQPTDVVIELPNLGEVTVRVTPRQQGMDIVLRFVREAAFERCQQQQQRSAQWLSDRLGQSVRLRMHREFS
ncbi:type III secretion system HrpP C-terminal domain-containing protein [Pseudomonas fluorescens]|uniref:Type III secretion protein n=1 Tax=Pseudomonas fluorescens TaxID=294 RepID=A0A944DLE3_PSEFL|nr:type III secretion system HrpP C-terminal domain-containing protein [Pseudomonas fluorescens]MBT2298539.1 hypothetical protein [Pseudomonas fluorescens]MBT2310064.1 hypothetical protein [Pseudomonas fluorescens]MBT2311088.1 hypothetical protein [Pseudomonas fluorescens]MBT2319977.1 hypothetical protein [Pseudomonas fluorescens]MBT2328995.1 hypothetical protein [Pseudomonas fluorescens]